MGFISEHREFETIFKVSVSTYNSKNALEEDWEKHFKKKEKALDWAIEYVKNHAYPEVKNVGDKLNYNSNQPDARLYANQIDFDTTTVGGVVSGHTLFIKEFKLH